VKPGAAGVAAEIVETGAARVGQCSGSVLEGPVTHVSKTQAD